MFTAFKKMQKRDKVLVLSLIIALLVAITVLAGSVIAKYVSEKSVHGKIVVSAELAKGVELFEHEAIKQDGGDYKLGTKEVAANKYVLMPGVDIPKDPTVRIKGYTGMAAFLYVEVVEQTLPDTITYAVNDMWTALTDVTGPHEGKVYYTELPSDQMRADQDGNTDVQILKKLSTAGNNEIQVSDQLDHSSTAQTSVLTFYAFIAQKTTDATAAGTFAQFTTQPAQSGN